VGSQNVVGSHVFMLLWLPPFWRSSNLRHRIRPFLAPVLLSRCGTKCVAKLWEILSEVGIDYSKYSGHSFRIRAAIMAAARTPS